MTVLACTPAMLRRARVLYAQGLPIAEAAARAGIAEGRLSADLRDARELDLKAWAELGAKAQRGGMPLGR